MEQEIYKGWTIGLMAGRKDGDQYAWHAKKPGRPAWNFTSRDRLKQAIDEEEG